MKQQKQVISKNDLPQRFGWALWVITYLIMDKFETPQFVWIIGYVLFGTWSLLFFYLKSIEKPFSIVNFKKNVEKWISE